MEPLGKMNAYFPVVNEHIAKRNKKVRVIHVLFNHTPLNPCLAARLRCRTEQAQQAHRQAKRRPDETSQGDGPLVS